MSAPLVLSERLLRLEQILAASGGSHGAAPNGDAAEALLASVMTERIRKTTAELERDAPIDAAVSLAMRLLLADSGAAVRQLRGVARIVERRLTDVADVMRNCKRDVERASG